MNGVECQEPREGRIARMSGIRINRDVSRSAVAGGLSTFYLRGSSAGRGARIRQLAIPTDAELVRCSMYKTRWPRSDTNAIVVGRVLAASRQSRRSTNLGVLY